MIVKDLLTTIDRLPMEEISIFGREESHKKTELLAETYHLNKTYYDYDKFLKGDMDTVYVALPNHLHYSFAKKALLCGKHVIIEKPITSNSRELLDLMEVAKSEKRMIFEAMNILYLPSFLALKEDLKELGDIRIVIFNYSQYSSRYDAFKRGEILPVFDPGKSGGALMDINIYNVYAMAGLFGMPEHVIYQANVQRGIDTSGIMTFDYGKFKGVSIGAKDCEAPVVSTIQGDRAVIVIEKSVNQMEEYRILYHDGREVLRRFGQKEHRLYYEFAEFMRMIEQRDYQKQEYLLNLSLDVSRLMESARKEAGVMLDDC